MKWIFAKNHGGRDSGFHDAGVETFKGNFDRYLARELIQNSLDARYDSNKPVRVVFELQKLLQKEVPDINGLKVTFERCAEFWHDQPKASAFFENAASLASAKTITALRIGDYNTTGVNGGDKDRQKNWYHLIRSAGSSSKMNDEGGSFGIGKNAPFAASHMRTVLYSTYNTDKEYVFQGVATLVSHTLPSGETAQATGYLGGHGGASLRDKDEIPAAFLRKKLGTDIFVLGFPEAKTWQNDLIYSVLENFWPAIDLGDLIVDVGGTEISDKTLPELLSRFSGEEGFTAHLYYKAFKDNSYEFHKKLPKLKDVSLYLSTGDNDLPKKIAMIRKTGMVIFARPFRSVLPFCGVFICRNEIGNKALRDMEPPRDDTWDPDHPDKGENRPIESEYVHWIRECIRELMPADDSKVLSVPDLSRFLPDDDESPEEEFESADSEVKSESAERSPLPEKIPGRKIDPRRSSMQPDNGLPRGGDGDEETATEGTEFAFTPGEGGGGGNGTGNGTKPEPGKTSKGQEPKPTIPIRYRTFATNLSAGVYKVTVQSEQKITKAANLVVYTVGDDQKAPADIRSARLADGKNLAVKGPGAIDPVLLPHKGVLHIEIRLREPLRLAMEVAAHEAE